MKDATANTKTTEVVNESGRTFTVRIIHEGDNYGKDDCLTYEKSEPIIEFFDKTHAGSDTPLGQFVSRYYLKTIDDGESRGINLHGGVDGWEVSAQNVQDAIAFAKSFGQQLVLI